MPLDLDGTKDFLLQKIAVAHSDQVLAYAQAYEALCRAEDLARRPDDGSGLVVPERAGETDAGASASYRNND